MPNVKVVPYNDGTESPVDQLTRTAAQLKALTVSMCGEGFENFSNLNPELQGHLLWLADCLADQLKVLSTQVESKRVSTASPEVANG